MPARNYKAQSDLATKIEKRDIKYKIERERERERGGRERGREGESEREGEREGGRERWGRELVVGRERAS